MMGRKVLQELRRLALGHILSSKEGKSRKQEIFQADMKEATLFYFILFSLGSLTRVVVQGVDQITSKISILLRNF